MWQFGELRDWVNLHSSLSKSLIIAQAQALRPGHTCAIDIPDDGVVKRPTNGQLDEDTQNEYWRMMKQYTPLETGGMSEFNHHYFLTFDDGVKWVMRCRRMSHDRPKRGVLRRVIESELETMDRLREAGVSVPTTYRPPDLPDHPDHPSQTGKKLWDLYFFMDYIEASKFPVAFLSSNYRSVDRFIKDRGFSQERLSTFILSFAQEMIKLSSITFSEIGSIYPSGEGGAHQVGGMIDRVIGFHEKPYFYGPFKTARERWSRVIDHQLDLILHHDGFGGNPAYSCLLLLDLKDVIQIWDELDTGDDTFYIKHVDSKGDQLFIDPDGNIVAWIDWEWAIVTTKEEAFAAPLVFGGGLMNRKLTIWETELVKAYEHLQRPDLAKCVRGGRAYHWLDKLCNPVFPKLAPAHDFQAFRAFVLCEDSAERRGAKEADAWFEQLRAKHGDDPQYQMILQRLAQAELASD